VPSFTEVGTYEVSYTVSKHGYNDVTGSYTFEIVKGDITGFEIEANEPAVYDGEAHGSATVTAGIPADAAVTYTCGSATFTEVPSFTEAGVYEVSYVVSKDGYNDVTGSYVFTVDVAQWDDGIELAGKAEYTGEPIAVADVSKLPEGAIFRFVLANEKGEFTEEGLFEIGEVPTFTEVGKYKLAYASYLDDNHEEHYGEFVFEIVEPAPETGDTFQLGLWLAVAALTAAAGIVLVLRRKEQA
jgi:methionine-rich copper-binding protein CopC